ncbi:MAG: hypothetical protein QW735_01920 [archaeon]
MSLESFLGTGGGIGTTTFNKCPSCRYYDAGKGVCMINKQPEGNRCFSYFPIR